MATTFAFDGLDDATRAYRLDVRRREGRGTPGVFVPGSNPWPWVGFFLGPAILVGTLLVTLLSDLVMSDPTRLALLQTAGVILGGWMFVAAFRVWGSKTSSKTAGHWTYADPLFLYEANGEQLAVTPVTGLTEAHATHNYNNGSYQNTAVRLSFAGSRPHALTLKHEKRAEALVVYYNYLAWARSGEGGGRDQLPPAYLGGVAKYVAKNDNEPLEADGNLNLNLLELDLTEVPEEPRRDGGGLGLGFLRYLVIAALAVVCFVAMREVNGPFRDEAVYRAVTTEPIEPRVLRSYFLMPSNAVHRDDVFRRLEPFYTRKVIPFVKQNGRDKDASGGMAALLESLKTAEQPAVSIRVKEEKSMPGSGPAEEREKKALIAVSDGVLDVLADVEPKIEPPFGMVFNESPPAIGRQLVAFGECPDGQNPHIDVRYKFEPADPAGKTFMVIYAIDIRDQVDERPLKTKTFPALATIYKPTDAEKAATDVAAAVARDLVGKRPPSPNGVPQGNTD